MPQRTEEFLKQKEKLRFVNSNYSSVKQNINADAMIKQLISNINTFKVEKSADNEDLCAVYYAIPDWLKVKSGSIPYMYQEIWKKVKLSINSQICDTNFLSQLLLTSGLPYETLARLWSIVNLRSPGSLTQQELYIMLSLIALVQNGCSVTGLSDLQQMNGPITPRMDYSLLGTDRDCSFRSSYNLSDFDRFSDKSSSGISEYSNKTNNCENGIFSSENCVHYLDNNGTTNCSVKSFEIIENVKNNNVEICEGSIVSPPFASLPNSVTSASNKRSSNGFPNTVGVSTDTIFNSIFESKSNLSVPSVIFSNSSTYLSNSIVENPDTVLLNRYGMAELDKPEAHLSDDEFTDFQSAITNEFTEFQTAFPILNQKEISSNAHKLEDDFKSDANLFFDDDLYDVKMSNMISEPDSKFDVLADMNSSVVENTTALGISENILTSSINRDFNDRSKEKVFESLDNMDFKSANSDSGSIDTINFDPIKTFDSESVTDRLSNLNLDFEKITNANEQNYGINQATESNDFSCSSSPENLNEILEFRTDEVFSESNKTRLETIKNETPVFSSHFPDLQDKYDVFRNLVEDNNIQQQSNNVTDEDDDEEFGDFVTADKQSNLIQTTTVINSEENIQECCLQACLQLLEDGLRIFRNIDNEAVLKHVLLHEKGSNYFKQLKVVYKTSQKFCKNYGNPSVNVKLVALWNDISKFSKYIPTRVTEESISDDILVPDSSKTDCSNICNLCRTACNNVSVVHYEGIPFHGACINLYLHFVPNANTSAILREER